MEEAFAAEISRQLAEVPLDATGVLITRLGAIRRNYKRLCGLAPSAETAAVLKANAYGLGAAKTASSLEREGCRTFFVATSSEASELWSVTVGATIFVLDGLLPGTAPLLGRIGARPVLGSIAEIAEWAAFCRDRGARYPAAIHIDTGMTRLGLTAEDAIRVVQDRETLDCLELSLVMSHLACADDGGSPRNDAQRRRFEELSELFPGVRRSLANSAGIHLGSKFYFEITRPGISLYGGRALRAGAEPVEPAAWLFARIAQVRWADPGEAVGYGGMTTLTRKTRVATVCAGYADGYMRAASASDTRAGPPAFVGPYPLPLLGRISMDLITFDATDVPEGSVMRGGWVELLGERVTVDDLAAFAGTIGYEVLTSLGRRYHRIYVDE